jgi:hypothetical protein
VRLSDFRSCRKSLLTRLTNLICPITCARGRDENIELQLANLQAGDDLERKAEELRAGTEIFRDAATRNRRNECCKKWKLQILTGGCCLAVVGVREPPPAECVTGAWWANGDCGAWRRRLLLFLR